MRIKLSRVAVLAFPAFTLPLVAKADVVRHRDLAVSALVIEEHVSGTWRPANNLLKEHCYRMNIDVVNRAGGPACATCVSGSCHEIYYFDVGLSLTPAHEKCYAFHPNDDCSGTASLDGWNSPNELRRSLGRYIHTKQIEHYYAPFVWKCASQPSAPLPLQRGVRIGVTGKTGEPFENFVSNPVAPHGRRALLGELCSSDLQCMSERCDPAPGHERRCIPKDGDGCEGEYCTHDNQCNASDQHLHCRIDPRTQRGTCRR
jgi:hypothetical protein